MWMWILIGLNSITKLHGFSNGMVSEACDSMAPIHERTGGVHAPQTTESPFVVDYLPSTNPGEPVTVILTRKGSEQFRGFMLEAREAANEARLTGKFVLFDPANTQLLSCGGLQDSAVSQKCNKRKNKVEFNWTATEAEQDIVFRATFVMSYSTFWENVTTILPQRTTTTTTTPKPTTATTPKPTTATTPKPTTATTPKPTTATTPKPTTAATPKPTTATTPKPTTATTPKPTTTTTPKPTTAATPKPTTATTPKPTTAATPKPTTATTPNPTIITSSPNTTNPFNKEERAGIALMCFDSVLIEGKMVISNIAKILLASEAFYHRVNEVSKIAGNILCVAAEISSMILLCMGDSCNVTLIALVCVVTVINFAEMVIVSLTIGRSPEVKKSCDIAIKVCFVIHEILTTAVIFLGVMENDDCGNNVRDSWLLKVMIAFTVWDFLLIIWVVMLSTKRTDCLRTNERNNHLSRWKRLRVTEMINITVSVILIAGAISFPVAVIVALFTCRKN